MAYNPPLAFDPSHQRRGHLFARGRRSDSLPPRRATDPRQEPSDEVAGVLGSLQTGQALGNYELLLRVATSPMTQTWAARLWGSHGTEQIVTLRTIAKCHLPTADAVRALQEGSRLASAVEHPNIARCIGLGDEGATFYIVGEWVGGEPLRDLHRMSASAGGIPLALVLEIVRQVCDGLHAAHQATDYRGAPLGILHGEVSPENVVVTYEGTTRLVGFGVGQATLAAASCPERHAAWDALAYSAPEHFRAAPVDHRSDVFSIGVLLYRLTTGRHPFRADTVEQTIRCIRQEVPPPPTRLVPGYPVGLEAIVLKALSKNPSERWSSARELGQALAEVEPGAAQRDRRPSLADFLNGRLGKQSAARLRALHDTVESLDSTGQSVPSAAS